ncbi:hypothetical protein ACFLQI_01080 [Candidatus Undinarchaeota archaeon]
MVVEHLLRTIELKKNPKNAFLLAILLSTLGIFVSLVLFIEYASVVMLFFVAIGFLPILESLFEIEEKEEENAKGLKQILLRNKQVFEVYFYFFLGLVVSYLFWYLMLGNMSAQIFNQQLIMVSGPGGAFPSFLHILMNNILVLTAFFFISLLYGAGSIFILAWNASIFSTLLIESARAAQVGLAAGMAKSVLAFSLHSIPEFAAFFLAANAGAVLSVGLIKERHKKIGLGNVVTDAFVLLILGYLVIIIAGVIEVTISKSLILGL